MKFIPLSTYRVQLNKDFGFKELREIIPYLKDLGISTIYASPVTRAVAGSLHGYDVTHPHQINPEIGTRAQFEDLCRLLKEKNMTWLQDIVPNHMAFHHENVWLMDVLERGPYSPYYNFFDVQWDHPDQELNGKIMVPFLGQTIEECIRQKEIQIVLDTGLVVQYADKVYPLSVPAVQKVLSVFHDGGSENLLNAATQSSLQEWTTFKTEFWGQLIDHSKIKSVLATLNNDPDKLKEVLDTGYYLLTSWRTAQEKINYRRFFTVNELICLRMEDAVVRKEYHTLFKELYDHNFIQGLRIDHIDGLNNPKEYIQFLRDLFGDDCYIIAEKILESKEDLPGDWPLDGTSGYEFLSQGSQLFTDRKGAKQLLSFYQTLVPETPDYDKMVIGNKELILKEHMQGEWNNLVHYLAKLSLRNGQNAAALKESLGQIMLHLPVYRLYPDELPLKGNSAIVMREALDKARQAAPNLTSSIDFFEHIFFPDQDEALEERINFSRRMMQFTGPLTAKGVEDTTFYVYNPLISHDEVGDSPSHLGISIKTFHKKMETRQRTLLHSLNATATHDTKRGEDARLRLNVLSEMPEKWSTLVQQWRTSNEKHKQGESIETPSVNDEYFLYQSLLAGFPYEEEELPSWKERCKEYFIKVLREAKVNSSWEDPNEAYENGCLAFIDRILSPASLFLEELKTFSADVSRYAHLYSLAEVLLKSTAPGIPDIYQGCEMWDLSYVDPDNRRAVDYGLRKDLLKRVRNSRLGTDVSQGIRKAGEKIEVTEKVLHFRAKYPSVFTDGSYIPVYLEEDVPMICFARNHKDTWIVVVVAMALVSWWGKSSPSFSIPFPAGSPNQWQDALSGRVFDGTSQFVFTDYPFLLLHGKT